MLRVIQLLWDVQDTQKEAGAKFAIDSDCDRPVGWGK